MKVYLGGPVSRMPDFGRGFRTEVSKFILSQGDEPISPLEKTEDGLLRSLGIDVTEFHAMKHNDTTRARFCEITREIIRLDLELLSNSDLMLAYWDPKHMGSGTGSELTFTFMNGIPSVIYLGNGVNDMDLIDSWAYACADLAYPSFDHVKSKWEKIRKLAISYKKARGDYLNM